ncbi:MAG: bifunctional hydroxymethylpyrimidine kinase/phosphomethylpyrimidine kinase [Iodobacter sp.]
MTTSPPIVLVFAGNDPSGGAGLAADMLALSSLGCHVTPVMTGVVIQDSSGEQDVLLIESDWVEDQARCILEDMKVDAIKVGLIGSIESLTVIAEIASDYPEIPLVLDPVFISKPGDHLAAEELLSMMRELLLPHTTLVTLNSIQARHLASDDPEEQDDISLDIAAARILDWGCEYVLITGTHENTPKVINTLYSHMGRANVENWERLPGSYHGSGSTLAAAVTGALANGAEMIDAVKEGQEYTWQTLQAAYQPGMGARIPDRFFWARPAEEVPLTPLDEVI